MSGDRRRTPPPMAVVVCGVSGCGKTTVGRLLAERLGQPFMDADDLHPSANVAKMRRGEPLDDADRRPWLAAVRATLQNHVARGEGIVVACSALKASYRHQLHVPGGVRFVHLHGTRAVLAERLAARGEHFFDPGLLDSQLATLEPPPEAIRLDVREPPQTLVHKAIDALR
ncbi:gluconokinase [Arhodomonas sp. AD133]|uniref:gluconokinase n=1 Tax=Arhodomonas sp. AD133 TaxID=3415009 RepID=UPI003EB9E39E